MDKIKLGSQAVGCMKWRWKPGMRALFVRDQTWRITVIDPAGNVGATADDSFSPAQWGYTEDTPFNIEEALPDLTDPATYGCLVHLVREVYSDPAMYAAPQTDAEQEWWVVCSAGDLVKAGGPSEIEAWLAALEAV